MDKVTYVLITPARNEEQYIEKTILSVCCQTILPQKWVIVDDGSTDRTAEIVKDYAERYEFIDLVHASGQDKRDFGSKVFAFREGYKLLKGLQYDFIGNLDADITFNHYYYEDIFKKFIKNSRLGIAGGQILELRNGNFKSRIFNINNVAGAVQTFRRRCYEDAGGYIPLKYGGIDAVAENFAKMKGWEVKTFSEIRVCHHRIVGTSKRSVLRGKFRYGVRDNLIGMHPLYMMVKCLNRFREKPYILSGILIVFGFWYSRIQKDKRPVPNEYIDYVRKEQKQRLLIILSKVFKFKIWN